MDNAYDSGNSGGHLGSHHEAFGAVTDPVSNAFSDAVRAICYAKEYGERAADARIYCYNGKTLPAKLVQDACESLRRM